MRVHQTLRPSTGILSSYQKSPSNMFSILIYSQELFRRRRKSCRYRCELFLITDTSLILLSAVGAQFYLFADFFFKFYLFPPRKTLLYTYHHFKARNISCFSNFSLGNVRTDKTKNNGTVME